MGFDIVYRFTTWGYILIGAVLLYVAAIPIRRAKTDREIRALGGRAPFIQTKWPLSASSDRYDPKPKLIL